MFCHKYYSRGGDLEVDIQGSCRSTMQCMLGLELVGHTSLDFNYVKPCLDLLQL